jgi:hypothetical protein
MTPEQLRKEAESIEELARVVSYRPDKARLTTKAAELRARARTLETRSFAPVEQRSLGRHGT